MSECCVYVLEFPNNKVYVGFTTNFKNRMRTHKRCSRFKNSHNPRLYNAIRKYGWDNIKKNIVYSGCNKDILLNEAEPFLIDVLSATNEMCGYNVLDGGNIGPYTTGETNPSFKRKGRKIEEYFTKEQIENKRKATSNAVAGSKNVHANKLKITSPKGEEYFINGGLVKFCKEHSLGFNKMFKWINKGIIPSIKKSHTTKLNNMELLNNCIGWKVEKYG